MPRRFKKRPRRKERVSARKVHFDSDTDNDNEIDNELDSREVLLHNVGKFRASGVNRGKWKRVDISDKEAKHGPQHIEVEGDRIEPLIAAKVTAYDFVLAPVVDAFDNLFHGDLIGSSLAKIMLTAGLVVGSMFLVVGGAPVWTSVLAAVVSASSFVGLAVGAGVGAFVIARLAFAVVDAAVNRVCKFFGLEKYGLTRRQIKLWKEHDVPENKLKMIQAYLINKEETLKEDLKTAKGQKKEDIERDIRGIEGLLYYNLNRGLTDSKRIKAHIVSIKMVIAFFDAQLDNLEKYKEKNKDTLKHDHIKSNEIEDNIYVVKDILRALSKVDNLDKDSQKAILDRLSGKKTVKDSEKNKKVKEKSHKPPESGSDSEPELGVPAKSFIPAYNAKASKSRGYESETEDEKLTHKGHKDHKGKHHRASKSRPKKKSSSSDGSDVDGG